MSWCLNQQLQMISLNDRHMFRRSHLIGQMKQAFMQIATYAKYCLEKKSLVRPLARRELRKAVRQRDRWCAYRARNGSIVGASWTNTIDLCTMPTSDTVVMGVIRHSADKITLRDTSEMVTVLDMAVSLMLMLNCPWTLMTRRFLLN